MMLTASDAALGELLATQVLLLHVWPDGAREVMRLAYAVQHLLPSLAGALALGITVMAHPSTRAIVILGYRRVRLTATGCDRDGNPVPDALSHPDEVTRLDVLDLAVAGQPAFQVTR